VFVNDLLCSHKIKIKLETMLCVFERSHDIGEVTQGSNICVDLETKSELRVTNPWKVVLWWVSTCIDIEPSETKV